MRTVEATPSYRSFFVVLFVAAFGVNWLWEMLQMPAYAEMEGRSWQETALLCTTASIGGALATLGIYGVGALASWNLRWGMTGRWKAYAGIALLGAGCAAAIEWMALASGRWSYSERMPVVLGLGLWPLLQLTLLVPAALWIAVRVNGQASRMKANQGR